MPALVGEIGLGKAIYFESYFLKIGWMSYVYGDVISTHAAFIITFTQILSRVR